MLSVGRTQALKLLRWQLWACLGSALLWAWIGWPEALAALVGGGICILANAVFAYYALKRGSARQARQIVLQLFLGEMLKILIIVISFAAAFLCTPLLPLPALVGFLFTQAVFWLAPLALKKTLRVEKHD